MYRKLGMGLAGLLLIAGMSVPAMAQEATASASGSCDENQIRTGIQQVIDQGFNQGNTAIVDQVFAPDYVDHPDNTTRDDFKNQITQIRTAIPQGQATVNYMLVQGCDAFFKFTETGEMTGALGSGQGSLPATNQPLTLATDVYIHFNDAGQAAEEWDYQDQLPFMMQAGLFPTNTPSSEATAEATAQASAPETISVGNNESRNSDAAKQLYDTDFNSGNMDAITALLDANYVGYNTDGSTSAATEFTGTLTALRSAMPDLKLTINGTVAEGDYVATRATLSGTFTSDLNFPGSSQAIPATNQPISLEMSFLDHFTPDGKIDQDWTVYDNVSFLSQLGLMSNMQATPEATP